MTQDATQFSVTVPTVLPVDVSATGVVTVANENNIINNSFGPVEVKSVSVESLKDWTLVDFDTDFKSKKVGLHEYGFQMNNTNVQPDGSCAAEFEVIPGNGQISFVYDSKVATQNTALTDEQIANVVFTIGWSDENATRPQLNATHKISRPKMNAALQNLTGKLTFTTTAYHGEGGVDISAVQDGSVIAVVSDQNATVYANGGVLGINTSGMTGMFTGYKATSMDLRGIDTKNMTNMSEMFHYCYELTSIDLSSFDTSKVTDMRAMFAGTSVENFDLRYFDTSNVTDIGWMFASNKMKILDLSSFDLKKVNDTYSLFKDCKDLIFCYGRTQADCDKLNRSSNKPSNVNFIVKPTA